VIYDVKVLERMIKFDRKFAAEHGVKYNKTLRHLKAGIIGFPMGITLRYGHAQSVVTNDMKCSECGYKSTAEQHAVTLTNRSSSTVPEHASLHIDSARNT